MNTKHYGDLIFEEAIEKQIQYFRNFFKDKSEIKYLYWKI